MNTICEFFQMFFWWKCLTSGKRAKTRETIAFESLQKIRTKFYEVAGHAGRVKSIVTNHLRKMSRSRIHKAAERKTAVSINSDELTDTNS